ncbi:protein ver-3, partial [Mytilus galloprovincialis]
MQNGSVIDIKHKSTQTVGAEGCLDIEVRCPIEVLQFKQYSFASDVYSLAMTIYEFFMTLSVNQKDPMAGELESAPFPNVALEDLRDNLFRDCKPDQPEACPEWLYEQMCRCWSKDKDKRPTCGELYTIIEKHLRDSDSEDNEILLRKQQQRKTKGILLDTNADANSTDSMEYGFVTNTDNELESPRANSVVNRRTIQDNVNIKNAHFTASSREPVVEAESEWYSIQAQNYSYRFLKIQHDLGEYPVKVDVQIKILENGTNFIFTGIGSAHRDDDWNRPYGGVVYIYNTKEVILTFPIKDNDFATGGVAFAEVLNLLTN